MASRIQPQSIDFTKLFAATAQERSAFQQTSIGQQIISRLSPSQIAALFPDYYKKYAKTAASGLGLSSANVPMSTSGYVPQYSSGGNTTAVPSSGNDTNSSTSKVHQKFTDALAERAAQNVDLSKYSGSPLSKQRQALSSQNDDNMKKHILALAYAEEGNSVTDRKRVIETMYNRAAAHNTPLNVITDYQRKPRYYEPMGAGAGRGQDRYAADLKRLNSDPEYLSRRIKEYDEVVAGSNYSNYATQNGSDSVGSNARKTQTVGIVGDNGEIFSRKDKAEYASDHGAAYTAQEKKFFDSISKAQNDFIEQQNAKNDPSAPMKGDGSGVDQTGVIAPEGINQKKPQTAIPDGTPKPVIDYLNTLPEDQRTNAINNMKGMTGDEVGKVFADSVEAQVQPTMAFNGNLKEYRIDQDPHGMTYDSLTRGGVSDIEARSLIEGGKRAFGDPANKTTRYVVIPQGGVRAQSTGLHGQGRAIDAQIWDREENRFVGGKVGDKTPNAIMHNAFGNPTTFRTYEILSQARYQWAHENLGEAEASKMSWGGQFRHSLEGDGPDEMHYSYGEMRYRPEGLMGGTPAFAKAAKEAGNESVGMGEDPLKWKSPLNPANFKRDDPSAPLKGDGSGINQTGVIAPSTTVPNVSKPITDIVPTEATPTGTITANPIEADTGATKSAKGDNSGENMSVEVGPPTPVNQDVDVQVQATTPSVQAVPSVPKTDSAEISVEDIKPDAVVQSSPEPTAEPASQAPTKAQDAKQADPAPTDDSPKMKAGGRVQASGEDISLYDNENNRKLGEVNRGENIRVEQEGSVQVTPEHRVDPRKIETAPIEADEAREEIKERNDNDRKLNSTPAQQSLAASDPTKLIQHTQWGAAPTPNSYIRAMEQAKGKRNQGVFNGSRFGEEQLSSI